MVQPRGAHRGEAELAARARGPGGYPGETSRRSCRRRARRRKTKKRRRVSFSLLFVAFGFFAARRPRREREHLRERFRRGRHRRLSVLPSFFVSRPPRDGDRGRRRGRLETERRRKRREKKRGTRKKKTRKTKTNRSPLREVLRRRPPAGRRSHRHRRIVNSGARGERRGLAGGGAPASEEEAAQGRVGGDPPGARPLRVPAESVGRGRGKKKRKRRKEPPLDEERKRRARDSLLIRPRRPRERGIVLLPRRRRHEARRADREHVRRAGRDLRVGQDAGCARRRGRTQRPVVCVFRRRGRRRRARRGSF